MRRAGLPLAILGLLGIAGLSDGPEPARRSPSSESRLAGAPALPETCVAPNAIPVGPSPTDGLLPGADRVLEELACLPAPSKVDRHVFLVEARLLEKYLAFRESLTSP